MPKDLSELAYLVVGAGVAAQEEMMRVANRLIDKGKSLTPEGRKKMAAAKKGLVSKGDDFSQVVARTVQRVLENAGIVTRVDLDDLDRKVDELELRIAAAKKPAAKKPAAKKPAGKKPAGKKPAAKKPAEETGEKPAAKSADVKEPVAKEAGAPRALEAELEATAGPVKPLLELIRPQE